MLPGAGKQVFHSRAIGDIGLHGQCLLRRFIGQPLRGLPAGVVIDNDVGAFSQKRAYQALTQTSGNIVTSTNC